MANDWEKFIHQTLGNKLPKQYVNFVGRRSMLEHTIRRAQKLIPGNRIVTIVSRDHLKYAEVRRQLSPYADQNVIVQPVNRETGPGVLLPLMHIYKRSPEAVVAVFPSDHFVWEDNRFMDYVDLAVQKVTGHPSEIVLLGVEAENAEPEYDYIIPQRDVLFDFARHQKDCSVHRKTECRHRPFLNRIWRALEHHDHGFQSQNAFTACSAHPSRDVRTVSSGLGKHRNPRRSPSW